MPSFIEHMLSTRLVPGASHSLWHLLELEVKTFIMSTEHLGKLSLGDRKQPVQGHVVGKPQK